MANLRYYGLIINVIMKDKKYIMSTELNDLYEAGTSNCCDAKVLTPDICADCGEHCEAVCEHEDRHVEDVEDYDGHVSKVYVCDACDVTLPGDPAEDAHDYLVDQQVMDALGK